MKKRLVSLILASIILFACTPVNIFAASADAIIKVKSISAAPGATVNVPIEISGNPGIAGATISLSYNNKLTLISAANGTAFEGLDFTQPGTFSNPCKFTWDSEDTQASGNGEFLVLTFKVSETAISNEKLNVDISYRTGDIFNDEKDLNLDIVNGEIIALDYMPGDVYEDRTINSKDTRALRQFIAGGYGVDINENAADVNADGVINAKDTRLLRRYIAGGYDVILLPAPVSCNHSMTATVAKSATCLENGNIAYWYCSECGKYYSDAIGIAEVTYEDTILKATGHTVVIDPAVEPTYTAPGKTEGSHCSVCNEIIVAQQDIKQLEKSEYTITYRTDFDEYLETIDFSSQISDEARKYTSDEGLYELPYLEVAGYDFIGWFNGTSSTATQITEIPSGSKGNKTLFAKWEEKEYKITFAIDAEIGDGEEPRTYSVSRDTELPTAADMAFGGYKWLGWSDEEGNLYNGVYPKGKIGNVTLHANWQSERNQAIANTNVKDFKVFVDDQAKTYNFTFDLGQIKNVPLHVVTDYGYLVAGSPSTEKETHQADTIKNETAQTIGNTVSNATTTSTSWMLSSDWNKGSTVSESHAKDEGIDIGTVDYDFSSNTSNISISSDQGGTSHETVNWGLNAKVYGKNTTTTSAELSATVPVKVVDVGVKVGVENKTEIGGEIGGYYDKTTVNDSYWNTAQSYNNSQTNVHSTTTSQNMSKHVHDSYGYTSHSNYGGSESQGESYAQSSTEEKEYSSAVVYKNEKLDAVTMKTTYTADTTGYWRQLIVGTVRVIGVVTYDIATCTYSISTYSIVEDETYEYMDYSITADRDKYVNGVLPLTVPVEVREYINNALGYSEGIIVDEDTGAVTGYNGLDKHFHIPDYFNISNGVGSNVGYTPVKTTSLANTPIRDENGTITGYKSPFENNTNIVSIRLGNNITEIPDNTFNGCSSLGYFESSDLTAIGNNAFAGCTALKNIRVDTTVEKLGTNAFTDVPNVEVYANNSGVVKNAVISGAKSLNIYLRYMKDDLADTVLQIPNTTQSVLINGRDVNEAPVAYSNVRIISDANATEINGMEFVNNKGVPMKFSSNDVTLSRIKVDGVSGLAIMLSADVTNLYLDNKSTVSTTGPIAILCHSVNIGRAPYSNSTTTLTAENGKFAYVSNFTDNEGLFVGAREQISEEEYNKYLNGVFTLVFDANGGSVDLANKEAYYGVAVGELPVATRDYYDFDGWYTQASGGEKVTEETILNSTENVTIYAQWIDHDPSGWVKASEVPADAQIVNTKWTYTQREYTSNAASSLSGWTKYDTKRTSWGSWSGWSTSNPSNGVRNVETRSVYDHTEYHYYRWTNGSGSYTYKYNSSYWLEEKWFTYILPVSSFGSSIGYVGTDKGANLWARADYAGNYSTDKTWSKSVNRTEYRYQDPVYTYYYYKDVNKETTSADPTGQSNVSNVVKWVQYKEK